MTLLHDAVFADKPVMIELLIASGIPVDAKTEDGVTPLLLACTSGKAATARVLLDKGASLGVTWNDRSRLFLAIDQGSLEIVHMLLARGVRVDERVKESGVTPLHLAATRGYREMVSALR